MSEITRRKSNSQAEFGDFQTPPSLARDVCLFIAASGLRPASIVEPTCGSGAFLRAALEIFPKTTRVEALDTNPEHVRQARAALASTSSDAEVTIREADFFATDWAQVLAGLPEPILVLGNPPWVTNSDLGILRSSNLPEKQNLNYLRGIDALTGKSNFDISEWMLRESLGWLRGKSGMLAVLCKTSVARKILLFAWREALSVQFASLHRLDAKDHFDAAVDACLLIIGTAPSGKAADCFDYQSLASPQPSGRFGFRDGQLVADLDAYERWKELRARGLGGWRSGVKHDCSRLFELVREGEQFRNGVGELVSLEQEVVFPLLKGSDLAHRREPRRWILVSQRNMADDPGRLETEAPRAWPYLTAHAALLDQRSSSIYKGRPRFSIFGIGPYTFARWKVAISGFYKTLAFIRVPPWNGKPVLFDDTCYFFPCDTEEECNALHGLLESEPAREFFSAFIFWDAKRPITSGLLNSLDLSALARVVGDESSVSQTLWHRQLIEYSGGEQQLLFKEECLPSAGDHSQPEDCGPLLDSI